MEFGAKDRDRVVGTAESLEALVALLPVVEGWAEPADRDVGVRHELRGRPLAGRLVMADFDMAVHGDVEPEAEIGPICGNVSGFILLFAKDKEDSLMSFLGAGVAIVKCRRGLRTKSNNFSGWGWVQGYISRESFDHRIHRFYRVALDACMCIHKSSAPPRHLATDPFFQRR